MVLKYIMLFLIVALTFSCAYEFPEVKTDGKYNFGDLNMDNFISVGDGYSSGFMNGSLNSDGQKSSVPAIISTQISKIEDGIFNQPIINSQNGFNPFASNEIDLFGKWIYIYNNNTDPEPQKILTQGERISSFDSNKSELNNFSLPFLKVTQFYDSGLSDNPYFQRIASNPGTSTLMDDIINREPTFFQLWIGMNDILNYAINGATGNTGELNTFKDQTLTSIADFELSFNKIVDDLLNNINSKGVVGNIISIKDLAYFYYNQYNFIRLENSFLGAAKSMYSKYNLGVIAHNIIADPENKRPFISFEDNGYTLYPQRLVVIDDNLPDALYPDGSVMEKYRMLNEGEIAFLNITPEMVYEGFGSRIPLSKKYYLTIEEINLIEFTINEFNNIINKKIAQYPERLALADINSRVHEIAQTGKFDAWGIAVDPNVIYSDGVPVEGGLGLNSIFSLDGLYFNQRGNALIANEFIEAVNSKFITKIPLADINNFEGNVYYTYKNQ